MNYSLKRWVALRRFLGGGLLPIDRNQVESQIRQWALGGLEQVVCRIATQQKTDGGDHEIDAVCADERA
ncbi:hypothetical protein BGP80_19510 [Pseudomonas putida]|uniref:Transposase IS66 central domain-containing protein n=1 Tax=Pseudomonas putida TaxID=303 RepID=A0A2S3WGE3_PSEPU|nr:hypothetical protein BGP80_19510 [Pseudomonas putida]